MYQNGELVELIKKYGGDPEQFLVPTAEMSTARQGVDRAASNTLPMTQEVLAGLVGARRQGISEAVHKLRARGLIAYERGSITVLDRAGVLASACECYAVVQAHIERLLSVV